MDSIRVKKIRCSKFWNWNSKKGLRVLRAWRLRRTNLITDCFRTEHKEMSFIFCYQLSDTFFSCLGKPRPYLIDIYEKSRITQYYLSVSCQLALLWVSASRWPRSEKRGRQNLMKFCQISEKRIRSAIPICWSMPIRLTVDFCGDNYLTPTTRTASLPA